MNIISLLFFLDSTDNIYIGPDGPFNVDILKPVHDMAFLPLKNTV